MRALTPLLLLIFTLILTYPLPLHMSTHVPGSNLWAFDEYTFIWNIWWFRHSILELHTSPLYTDYIFFPVGTKLILYTYNLFNCALALPLTFFLPLPLVSNLVLIFTWVVSGWGAYLLALYLLRRNGLTEHARAAAIVAGLLYAFASNRHVYAALGHYDMVSTQWLPFYILYFIRTAEEPGLKNPSLAALFATLAMLCEMIFGTFLFIFSVFYLFLRRNEVHRQGLYLRMAILVIIVLLTYWPVLIPILREFIQGEYELKGWGDALKLSTDFLGFFTPTALHPGLGTGWDKELKAVTEGTSRFSDVNTVFLGYVSLAMATIALLKNPPRMVKTWVAQGLLFASLCLGPVLQINKRYVFDMDGIPVTIPMPFALLHYIPVFRANRVPNRFSVILTLCLAVLVAFGIQKFLSLIAWRFSPRFSRVAGAVIAVLILTEHLAIPLPLTDARIPAPLLLVGQEEGDFTILQLPLGWRNSFGMAGAESTQAQYYQTAHGKRLLAGNISRNPPFQFDYFLRLPFFQAIVSAETYREISPELETRARAQALELASLYNIRYLVVLPPTPGRPPYSDTYTRTLELVEEILPAEPYLEGDGAKVYRVRIPPPVSRLEIDFGTEEALPHLGEGWDRNEEVAGATAVWAVSRRAEVFLPPTEKGPFALSIRIAPFTYPGSPEQTLKVLVNGAALGEAKLSPGWNEVSFSIPEGLLSTRLNRLEFRFSHLASPRKVFPPEFAIGSTGVNSPAELEIHSGQGFAFMTVGGRNASLNEAGLNLAVVDPKKGNILAVKAFKPGEEMAFLSFVENIIPGSIVMGSAYRGLWPQNASYVLQSLGLKGPSEGPSYAFIGIKGSPPGSGLEKEGEDVYLRLGYNPDARTLAAAVDFIRLERR